MKKLLEETFKQTLKSAESYEIISNTLFIILDSDRRISINFSGNESLILNLISKTRGEIHSMEIRLYNIFSDYCTKYGNSEIEKKPVKKSEKLGERYAWYSQPTSDNIREINSLVEKYIRTWK